MPLHIAAMTDVCLLRHRNAGATAMIYATEMTHHDGGAMVLCFYNVSEASTTLTMLQLGGAADRLRCTPSQHTCCCKPEGQHQPPLLHTPHRNIRHVAIIDVAGRPGPTTVTLCCCCYCNDDETMLLVTKKTNYAVVRMTTAMLRNNGGVAMFSQQGWCCKLEHASKG